MERETGHYSVLLLQRTMNVGFYMDGFIPLARAYRECSLRICWYGQGRAGGLIYRRIQQFTRMYGWSWRGAEACHAYLHESEQILKQRIRSAHMQLSGYACVWKAYTLNSEIDKAYIVVSTPPVRPLCSVYLAKKKQRQTIFHLQTFITDLLSQQSLTCRNRFASIHDKI